MKIRCIQIQNYRSIKNLEIIPGDITTLVGPNNSGKTNILSALHFLLGDRFPMITGLDDKDFYNKNRENEILVRVYFEKDSSAIDSVYFHYDPDRKEGRSRYSCRGKDLYLSNEVRKLFPLVYLDANRSYDSQFGSSRWSLFGQIIRQLDTHFREQVSADVQEQVKGHLDKAQELLKTPLYRSFESEIAQAFKDQVRMTTHEVSFDFRTFDPLNFYKSLSPILFEHGEAKNPSEAGSGMRNLIVMALFRAYARAFKGNALIAVEEPEIYLHPHAQRSLATLFREISSNGVQLFYSTHSASFLSVEHFDQVFVVERCKDDDDEICTKARSLSSNELLETRKRLLPQVPMTVPSMKELLRNACSIEHAEAFFSRAIVLVEGETECAALPIYAASLKVDFDALGISVVSANGKAGLDTLYQLYSGLGFQVFLIFDNDLGGDERDIRINRILTRMLSLEETDRPVQIVTEEYAIMQPDFEGAVKRELDILQDGLYDELRAQAAKQYGAKSGKPIVARHIAREVTRRGLVLPTVRKIVDSIRYMTAFLPDAPAFSSPTIVDEDDIPF